jgi:hypothetical protein
MARYLVTYHGSEMSHEPEAMLQARNAFMAWAQQTGPALVEPGAPVIGMTTISGSGTDDGPAQGPLQGWSVIEAESPAAAAQILSTHPFIGRGGSLQVSEPAPI